MADTREKGTFQADIPSDAVAEALESVERISRGDAAPEADPPDEGEPLEIAAEDAPVDPELESLRAQLALSQEKARETLDRLKDTHERHLRAAADLENYKKRAAREREEIQKFGNEALVKDLLPVMDDLDRALQAAPPSGALTDGVKLVRASLERVLAKHGVKGFSALGQPFDPARHEALLQVPTAEQPPGTVVLEHARGFMLNDRLVRPAMVGVAIAPPAPAAAPGGAASAGGPSGQGEQA